MDNLADHTEADQDTEWGIQNSLAAVVDRQAADDSQDMLDNHQLADNSCKG